jgi:uncharacterized protein (DUF2235 family)
MASLIICLDGTWNNADSAEAQTNIGLLVSMIDPKPEGGIPAQIYYDAGVGTSGSATHRLAGGLLGKGLSTNILEAYRFLSLNYRPGDHIYIFGYSRGAYTARSLCGFLSASGLLRADACDHSNQDFAWRYYRTGLSDAFRLTRSDCVFSPTPTCACASSAYSTRWARSAFRARG